LGEASNFAETISMTAALKPDVILLDVHMPDDRSFKPEFVKASLCRARVLAMSVPSDCKSDEETRLLAENFGAVRVSDKAKLSDELIPAILQRRLDRPWPISGVMVVRVSVDLKVPRNELPKQPSFVSR